MIQREQFIADQSMETFGRVDKVLAQKFSSFSRSYFQYLIQQGAIRVNGQPPLKRTLIREGDTIDVEFIPSEEYSLEPQNIPLDILYEDEHIIAINKPAGMVVHPAPGNPDKTFVNALLYHCKNLERDNTSERPGIVHRLDKDTTGILIAAKTRQMQAALTELFSSRQIIKEYIAISVSSPRRLTSDSPIARHSVRRQEMAINFDTGKSAQTDFEVIARTEHLSLIRALPKTGRTHQIRVHLKELGSPILGDQLYTNSPLSDKYRAKRQMLHARSLTFVHPVTGESMRIEAPIPSDMQRLIDNQFKK